jgi:hypothetical protein
MDTWFAGFTTFGTVAVAVMAIWGDWIRARIAGPRLTLSLRAGGYLTPRTNGTQTWNAIYYHLEVGNERPWSPARSVRVKVEGIAKRRPDGSYFPENVLPLQLTWIFPELLQDRSPTIASPSICDLGYLDQRANRFLLATYEVPFAFAGSISGGEAMRVTLVASADNGESRQVVVEISWDGAWVADIHQVQQHLVVKEVAA